MKVKFTPENAARYALKNGVVCITANDDKVELTAVHRDAGTTIYYGSIWYDGDAVPIANRWSVNGRALYMGESYNLKFIDVPADLIREDGEQADNAKKKAVSAGYRVGAEYVTADNRKARILAEYNGVYVGVVELNGDETPIRWDKRGRALDNCPFLNFDLQPADAVQVEEPPQYVNLYRGTGTARYSMTARAYVYADVEHARKGAQVQERHYIGTFKLTPVIMGVK